MEVEEARALLFMCPTSEGQAERPLTHRVCGLATDFPIAYLDRRPAGQALLQASSVPACYVWDL